ncbi:MAG: NUDIX domain-containing protein [Planctomycetota bacterium]
MPIPDFLQKIRARIGHDYVLLPAVAAVVQRADGKVLMLRRADNGEWSLPSGICEPSEDPSHTIVREIAEETGLRARPTRILAVFGGPRVSYPNGDLAEYVTTLFHCEVLGGTLEALDGEALELRFVDLGDVPSLSIDPHLPAPLAHLLQGPGGAFPWSESWLDDGPSCSPP